MRKNINDWERTASLVAGTALAVTAARQHRGRAVSCTAATWLVLRGLTGYCPVSAAIGRDSRLIDSRDALGGSSGIHVRERITIARPVHEVYSFWRDFANLPRFMRHLERVELLTPTRSRWTARGPAGTTVSWEAEIINEIPNELIGWRSLVGADVASAGSVSFEPLPHGGTEIKIHLQYNPLAGKLGSWVAYVLGEEPSLQIREDLQRIKTFLENDEIPAIAGQVGR